MRKLIYVVALCLIASVASAAPISTIPYNTPDDITIDNMESNRVTFQDAINFSDGGLIGTASISADSLTNNANPEKRWADSFNSYVVTGLLPPTSATLVATTTAGRALIINTTDNEMKYVEKSATTKTYTASKDTYVDLSASGTYTYNEVANGAAEPTTTSNSIRLAKVVTSGTAVTSVTDSRITAITLGSTQEDFQRVGLTTYVTTPDEVQIDAGILYHGTTRISKTSKTDVDLGTASDWATGVSQRAVSTTGYTVINSSGSVKLTTTAPLYSDVSGNSQGKPRYSLIGSDYWRVLNWYRMNATGSGNIDDWGYSDISENGIVNSVFRQYVTQDTGSIPLPKDTTIPQITEGHKFMEIVFMPTEKGKWVEIESQFIGSGDSIANGFSMALFQDAIANALTATTNRPVGNSDAQTLYLKHRISIDDTDTMTFQIRAGQTDNGSILMNGDGASNLIFGVASSFIRVEEKE